MGEWIDIKLQKPEVGKPIMINGAFPTPIDAVFEKTKDGFRFVKKNGRGDVRHVFQGVTHWMLLPNPSDMNDFECPDPISSTKYNLENRDDLQES